MKKLSILLFVFLMNYNADAQGCLPEGIKFSTQAQIDSFPINYPGCTYILGDVEIIGGYGLTNLNGLSAVNKIDGGVFIWSNYALTNLLGLNNLDSIGGDLTIGSGCMWFGNYALTSLDGLNSLVFIGGSLYVGDNHSLTDLSGLNNLTYISVNLGIFGCGSLSTINGFNSLTTLGGSLIIDGNYLLTNLTGFHNLTSIGGSLIIGKPFGTGSEECPENNPNLADIESLSNLTSIGGKLQVNGSQRLKCLAGLESIAAASISNLEIIYNDSLSSCEVQSICNYLASPGGSVRISSNTPGCNSPEEVEALCIEGVKDLAVSSRQSAVGSFPNPFTQTTTIDYKLELDAFVSLTLFSHLGKKIDLLVNEMQLKGIHQVNWNAGNLAAGIYYYRLEAGKHTATGKMILMR